MDLLKAHARRREPVHHGSPVALAAIRGHAFVAEVINENEHDIGFLRIGGTERGERREQQRGENREEAFHGSEREWVT